MRGIRRALGLFVVDILIIIGIFVLQFRTDSNIIEKIGNLQVTLTKSDSDTEAAKLKNKMQATYNGVSLYFDEQTPPYALLNGATEKTVATITGCEKSDDKITLLFDNNIKISLILSEISEDSPLSIFAELPQNIKQFYLPYNFAYNMKIQKDEGKNVVLNSKKSTWNFTTEEVKDGYIVFSQKALYASYSIYNDVKKFTFEDLSGLATAEGTIYLNTINNLRSNLITSFRTTLADNSFTEQAVVSYVAAMAESGKFKQAIDDIPQSYKRSDQRTYLSAPYFNNLVAMNNTLEQQIKADNNNIAKAVYNDSLDIFTVHNIAAKLCIYPTKSDVMKILQRAADADISSCGIAQVTGIIQTFDDLCTINTDYAKVLRPAIDSCIERLTDACKFENNVLTISENDTFLSVIQAVETGAALLRYGELTENDTYIRAGRVIICSYLGENASFDLRTLVNLYPLVSYNNWYYPHIKIIRNDNGQLMWAWTCAQDITWARESDGGLNLRIKFPLELTHYVIFKGIPEFESIYIYNIAFRTDPRFETYNSSGYVYRSGTNTLLIKSRHKSEFEDIKMLYKSSKPANTTTAKPTATTTDSATETKTATSTAASTSNTTTETTAAPEVKATDSSTSTTPATTTTDSNTTQASTEKPYQNIEL